MGSDVAGNVVIKDGVSVLYRNADEYNPTERQIFLRAIVFCQFEAQNLFSV